MQCAEITRRLLNADANGRKWRKMQTENLIILDELNMIVGV
jgi:hypothetical protein